jgi:hypothetical protein
MLRVMSFIELTGWLAACLLACLGDTLNGTNCCLNAMQCNGLCLLKCLERPSSGGEEEFSLNKQSLDLLFTVYYNKINNSYCLLTCLRA